LVCVPESSYLPPSPLSLGPASLDFLCDPVPKGNRHIFPSLIVGFLVRESWPVVLFFCTGLLPSSHFLPYSFCTGPFFFSIPEPYGAESTSFRVVLYRPVGHEVHKGFTGYYTDALRMFFGFTYQEALFGSPFIPRTRGITSTDLTVGLLRNACLARVSMELFDFPPPFFPPLRYFGFIVAIQDAPFLFLVFIGELYSAELVFFFPPCVHLPFSPLAGSH